MLVAFISSIVALSACNNGADVNKLKTGDDGAKVEQKENGTTSSTSTTSSKQEDSATTEQSSIQSNLPLDKMYPDPEVRNYAERFIGVEAPDFTLQNVDGESVSLSDYKGQNVILEMAQTTCHVCLDTQPKLNEFKKTNPDITVVQVFNEPTEAVKGFLDKTNSTDTKHSLVGDANKVFSDYEVKFVPILLFIDKEGTIKVIHVGQLEQDVLKLYSELAFE